MNTNKMQIEIYPTLKDVDNADRYQICKWYRYLRMPFNPYEELILVRICERFRELGGFTPDISKHMGWH